MDNQENETFTPPEVTATLLPPNRDTWSGSIPAIDPVNDPLWRQMLRQTSNEQLVRSLRMHHGGLESAESSEALARLLEAMPVKRTDEQIAADQQAEIDRCIQRHAVKMDDLDRWLSSLQSMPLADLAAELSEEGALRYRGLLWRAYGAMQAFTDPEGRMPADTGEFNDLKAIMLELEAALGI